MKPEHKPLTLKEAAEYCGMSYPVFRDWFDRGKIPSIPTRPGSSRRKIQVRRLDEFCDWLETDEASEVK